VFHFPVLFLVTTVTATVSKTHRHEHFVLSFTYYTTNVVPAQIIISDFFLNISEGPLQFAPPLRAPDSTVPWIHLLISVLYVYIVCLFASYDSPLILFFFTFSLLIFSFENRPARFPGQRS